MVRNNIIIVVSAMALALIGCSKPERVEAPDDARPHFADAWLPYRADTLNISVDEARARDAAVDEHHPLELDRPALLEASAIYRSSCASCHGLDGKPTEPPEGEKKPRAWGTLGVRMGFFFGGDKMRAGLYKTIREGGPAGDDGKPSRMPSWGNVLSREQTWGLVRELESF